MKDYRCPECGRLLFQAEGVTKAVAFCRRCRLVKTFRLAPQGTPSQNKRQLIADAAPPSA